MHPNLLDQELQKHVQGRSKVTLTLTDNTVLVGTVKDFDPYIVLLSDEHDTIVYRHSVLKFASGEPQEAARKDERPRAEERRVQSPRSRTAPPRPPRDNRPARQQRPLDKPAPRIESEEEGVVSPMAAAMQKWLERQKSGG